MSLNIHLIRSEVGYEGGAVYTVTFEDVVNPGDVPLLIAHSEGLTGVGATVVTREMRKGSEAIGTAVRVGFSAPQHCSTSQVRDGHRLRDLPLWFWNPLGRTGKEMYRMSDS